ncbi:MAG TPA: PEP-CTERM sorting domain-containing protein [Rhodocyclaceae bacterium]|nr:PEP-CTERM sorting domain-containing protein [Rhodocyclaceae bacterium]
MKFTHAFATATLIVLPPLVAHPASATTINGITVTQENIFRDVRGINDVGIAQGDVFQFGANISGGSAGYSGAGIFTPAGATNPTIVQSLSACSPLSVNANFCSRTSSYTPAKANGTWQFQVSNGTDTAVFALPPTTVIPLAAVPFPTSVTIANSANGVQPTISWTLPSGASAQADAYRVNIYDRSSPPLAGGSRDIIYSTTLQGSATQITIPLDLGGGRTLTAGNKYTINFQVISTRDGASSTNDNANVLSRSSSFFDFTPQPGDTTPSNILLPMVDGATGVYHFSTEAVGPDSITYIDPEIAIGYIYAIGAGDPNFASVLLPNVGDGLFELLFDSISVLLHAGEQFFFPTGGVSTFKVLGIEASAGLDPADTQAFVTGLTFVRTGSFTGTMTPITLAVGDVPEPETLALLGLGLAVLIGTRRRKRFQA